MAKTRKKVAKKGPKNFGYTKVQPNGDTLGEYFKRFKIENQVNHSDLYKRTGIAMSTFASVEKDKYKNVFQATVDKLVPVFGLSRNQVEEMMRRTVSAKYTDRNTGNSRTQIERQLERMVGSGRVDMSDDKVMTIRARGITIEIPID